MEDSLCRFMVTQRLLGFLRRENLAGFALGPRKDLWVAPVAIDHPLAMGER